MRGDIYVLESISGRPIPAPYSFNPDFNDRIHADTMAFASGGVGERRTQYDSYQGTLRLDLVRFTYTRTGDRVEINFECPPGAVCIAPPHLAGTISTTGLTITESKITRLPMIFRLLSLAN